MARELGEELLPLGAGSPPFGWSEPEDGALPLVAGELSPIAGGARLIRKGGLINTQRSGVRKMRVSLPRAELATLLRRTSACQRRLTLKFGGEAVLVATDVSLDRAATVAITIRILCCTVPRFLDCL